MTQYSYIDFKRDLYEEIKNKIIEYGYTCPTREQLRQNDRRNEEIINKIVDYDLLNLLQHFFTISERRIPIIKRSVHISKELGHKLSLDIYLKNKVDNLKNLFERGENINSYLSNKIRKIDQTGKSGKNSDKLLYEWNIYHLHFDINRSKELLFLMVFTNAVLFIDVLGHENEGKENITWTNTNLVQIVHDNWPQAISDFIFARGKKDTLTSEERKTLRSKSVNTTVIVKDGTEYIPLGGGFSSSSHPTYAIINSDKLIFSTRNLEKVLNKNMNQLISLFNQKGIPKPEFKLKLDDDLTPFIYESISKSRVNLIINQSDDL